MSESGTDLGVGPTIKPLGDGDHMAKLKLQEETIAEARSAFDQATAAHRQLDADIEGCRAAIALAGGSFSETLRERAQRYLQGRTPSLQRLQNELSTLLEKREPSAETLRAAQEAYQDAAQREVRRLAQLLRPRHAAAVKKIGAALEQLAAAVEEEKNVRRELDETALTGYASGLAIEGLPDLATPLAMIGDFTQFNSPASFWAREARRRGYL